MGQVTTVVGHQETRERTARWDARKVAAGVAILVWAVHLVASWAGGYQLVPMQTLQDEIGRVQAYQLVRGVPGPLDGGEQWYETRVLEGGSDASVLSSGAWSVAYTTGEDRPRVAVPGFGRHGPWLSSVSDATPEERAWVQEHLLSTSVSRGDVGRSGAEVVTSLTGLALAGLMLLHVVAGPRPRHGTRWFWFWLIALPGGLGVVAYALLEVGSWRDQRVPAEGRRPGGLTGLVMLLAWGAVVLFLLSATSWLLGVSIVPL